MTTTLDFIKIVSQVKQCGKIGEFVFSMIHRCNNVRRIVSLKNQFFKCLSDQLFQQPNQPQLEMDHKVLSTMSH